LTSGANATVGTTVTAGATNVSIIPVNAIVDSEENGRYNVYLAAGLLSAIGKKAVEVFPRAKTIAIVTDETVKAIYAAEVVRLLEKECFNVICFSLPSGEASKTAESYIALLNWLCENRLTRSDAIIALGGGVIGDLAGFAAATYLRGIPVMQVPTTLLAMVDSSVGGKTGIDLLAGKNLAGAFYQPSAVLCDPTLLQTLPPDVFADGCAEVIKYGMIRDGNLLEKLARLPIQDQLAEVISTCITIKRDIVQNDVRDTGERQLLNFGHSLAHAIEKLSAYEVSHGKAVAIGMGIMTRAAERKKLCPPDCSDKLKRLLAMYGLPDALQLAGLPYSPCALYEAALSDKKRSGSGITEIVPVAVGECVLKTMHIDELLQWIELGLST